MKRTIHEYLGYVFTISYRPAEPIFTVDFADFPAIITSGDTLAEAFANACEALETCLFGFDLRPGDEVVTTNQDYPRTLAALHQRERRDEDEGDASGEQLAAELRAHDGLLDTLGPSLRWA